MRDGLGMFCSGLCVVQCLIGPVLVATGGLALVADERVHQALLVPVLALAVWSFPVGYCRHHAIMPGLLGFAGALAMVAAVAAGGFWETPLSILGGAGLISGHWVNRRLACCCPVPQRDRGVVS